MTNGRNGTLGYALAAAMTIVALIAGVLSLTKPTQEMVSELRSRVAELESSKADKDTLAATLSELDMKLQLEIGAVDKNWERSLQKFDTIDDRLRELEMNKK